ncbi:MULTISPECIES: putative bifunctional diguanylate cyclase/phosphodiesterase [Nostocales]|uniref:EAL domain-containing protein n=3 Tax=Nostocales TaxID=1161 RepID=A0A8S9TAJ8_9CYAN|nr:GGDEF domain-containing response regulator [Tolypothrix bouteillei]KAF3889186.1 EAL domain-containing protein [Tolypothrix bouteillei VB521301]
MAVCKGDILIVDDTLENLRFLSTTLIERGYKVRSVTSGAMALVVAQTALPNLILLDIRMPEEDGYEVCQRLKMDTQTREIPVIFLSAANEVIDKVRAFEVGGVDYVTKPFHLEELLARIDTHLSLQAARQEIRKLNVELEERVRLRTIQLEREIVERQKLQEKLLHIALHDSLTGLLNRAWLMERLQQLLEHAQQYPNFLFAILFLDCDRFKIVNDSLGHLVGDRLLIAIARRLESCLPPGSTLARLGGDEFTILLENIQNVQAVTTVAERILQEFTISFKVSQSDIFSNVSIGIVLGNKSYEQPEHLLRDADTAMYQAKGIGKGCYQVFDPAMHHHALNCLEIETDLRQATEQNELIVYYQPIVSLTSGRIVGFEALVRWQHPKQGLLSPNQFIFIAEQSELIIKIDLWVMREACRQLRLWQNEGLIADSIKMSVNLSVKHLTRTNLIQEIDSLLQESRLDRRDLRLEITESGIMGNAEIAASILEQLKYREIHLSIDDFGTGYSSLSYLQRLPVNTLKIDRSFISRIQNDGQNTEIIRAIIALSDSLGIQAIAEGVETSSQLQHLRTLGCAFGQGYFFSPPLNAESAMRLLQTPPQWL